MYCTSTVHLPVFYRDCCDESIDIKTFLKQTEEHIQERTNFLAITKQNLKIFEFFFEILKGLLNELLEAF
jgi:hypothetical protein